MNTQKFKENTLKMLFFKNKNMKTKINNFFTYLAIFSGVFLFGNASVWASSLEWVTSGIKYSGYDITWTSPYSWEQKVYLKQVGNTGIITYTWGTTVESEKVKINTNLLSSTRSTNPTAANLFQWVDRIIFQWEWKYEFKIILVDSAYNSTVETFTYQVDKTAPQVAIESIINSSGSLFLHIWDRISTLTWAIVKYDSNIQSSDSDAWYEDPLQSEFTWDVPVNRSIHTRSNLFTVYFKNTTSWSGANTPFDVVVDYNHFFKNPVSLQNGRVTLHTSTGVLLRTLTHTAWKVTLNTSMLPLWEDSQWQFKLRFYDSTIGRSGPTNSNFSEVVFYAVRDNTPPNLTNTNKNIITNQVAARRDLLQFVSWTHVWDASLGNDSKFSKFIAANSWVTLKSVIHDIGINQWPSVDARLFNAWIPEWTAIKIESSSNSWALSDVFSYELDKKHELTAYTKPKNFSLVDNDLGDRWYRYYDVEFKNRDWLDGVCDFVGNCLTPELEFRVMADEMDASKSILAINNKNEKSIANAQTQYEVSMELKDRFNNRITSVHANEWTSPLVRRLSSEFIFQNELFLDQLNITWERWAILSTNATKYFSAQTITWWLNTSTWNIILSQNSFDSSELQKNWVFKFDIWSYVSTPWSYPYLAGSWMLLKNIKPKVILGTTSWLIYGSGWVFDNNYTFWNTNNLVTLNTSIFTGTELNTDIDNTGNKIFDYGKVTQTWSINLLQVSSNKLSFEFASPYIYNTNLNLAPLYTDNSFTTHTKQSFNSGATLSNIKIHENFLVGYNSGTHVPNVLRFDYENPSVNVSTWYILSWSEISDLVGWRDFRVKASRAQWTYDFSKSLNLWYVAKIDYILNGKQIQLPSISRNIAKAGTTSALPFVRKQSAWYFYRNNYTILNDGISQSGLAWFWIAVTGVTNRNETSLSNSTWQKANINVGWELTRYELIKTVKSNIASISRWKNWCPQNAITSYCEQIMNGEKVTFITWNASFSWTYDKKETYIVKNWNIYIDWDISNNNLWQLTLVSMTENGLSNVNITSDMFSDNWFNRNTWNYNGWIFINPEVTNIDASLIAEWPVVSYDVNEEKLYGSTIDEKDLRNQLHIYGSLLSLNTIGWAKEVWATNHSCPYIISPCNRNTASVFDLANIRKFTVQAELNGITWAPTWKSFAFHPTDMNTAKRSGWSTWLFELSIDDTPSWLRVITDDDYKTFPLFIERDARISSSPSIIFKTDR